MRGLQQLFVQSGCSPCTQGIIIKEGNSTKVGCLVSIRSVFHKYNIGGVFHLQHLCSLFLKFPPRPALGSSSTNVFHRKLIARTITLPRFILGDVFHRKHYTNYYFGTVGEDRPSQPRWDRDPKVLISTVNATLDVEARTPQKPVAPQYQPARHVFQPHSHAAQVVTPAEKPSIGSEGGAYGSKADPVDDDPFGPGGAFGWGIGDDGFGWGTGDPFESENPFGENDPFLSSGFL